MTFEGVRPVDRGRLPLRKLSKARAVREHLGAVIYNTIVTHIPSHTVRLWVLRLWGAEIGRDTSILMGTTVLGIENLRIGDRTTIGSRCLLDARGSLTIGNNVVVASDVHFVGGGHDINSPEFTAWRVPIVIEDYAWIASRATVVAVTVGRGAVVGACALVRENVPPLTVVGGVPSKPIGTRNPDALRYSGRFRPPLM